MAEQAIHRPDEQSWNDRVFDALPLSPAWVAVLAVLALGLLFVGLAAASGVLLDFLAGDRRWWQERDARFGIVVILMAAYLPAARRYVTLGARRNYENLRPILTMPHDFEELPARAQHTGGWIALLLPPLVALGLDRDPGLYLRPGYWNGVHAMQWTCGLWLSWHLGCFGTAVLRYAGRFSDLAKRVERIDLFDPAPLAPFTRQGLHAALLWVVLVSFYTLNAGDRGFALSIALLGLLGLGVAVTALLLPVRGIHRRIQSAKSAELARVHAAIAGDAEALADSAIARRAATASLADLLAYRSHVASVREWPFDTPTLLRSALLVAIPMGSWLGGALMERLLGTWLD